MERSSCLKGDAPICFCGLRVRRIPAVSKAPGDVALCSRSGMSLKSVDCCVQRNLFRLGDIGEIDRSQYVTEKIKAESKTFKNRYAAYEEDVNAALQLIAQFFVSAAFAPRLICVIKQSAEFFAGIEAEPVAVAYSLPCPLKVSQSFLRIVQILVAEKLGKEFLSGQPKGSKIGQRKIGRHGNIHKSSF